MAKKKATIKTRSELNHKYIKPTTANQRQWNREIDRLLRFQKEHKGINVPIPEKPKRITKTKLKEIKAMKGKKILEKSTVNVPTNDPNRELKAGEMNAKEYFDKVVGQDKTLKEGEKTLKSNIEYDTERAKMLDEIKDDYTETELQSIIESGEFPDSVIDDISMGAGKTFADNTIEEFKNTIRENYRPSFQRIMFDWLNDVQKTMTNAEIANALNEMEQDGHPIDHKIAYDFDLLMSWATEFVNNADVSLEIKQRLTAELNDMANNQGLRDWFDYSRRYRRKRR